MPNLRKENRDLIALLQGIRSDLLMRGTKEKDGTTVVELSNGLWQRLNEVLTIESDTEGRTDKIGKIPEHHKQWFKQLKNACAVGDLAIMSCLDAKTLEPRTVLTLVGRDETGFVMTPVGHLCTEDNPYEAYLPPRTEQETIR